MRSGRLYVHGGPASKMADPDMWSLWGLKSSLLLSGFAGGLSAALMGSGSLVQRATSASVGFMCANFVGPQILQAGSNFYAVTPATEAGVGFVVGLCGMTICDGIVRFVNRSRDRAQEVADDVIDRRIGKK